MVSKASVKKRTRVLHEYVFLAGALLYCYYCSEACGIEVAGKFVITGGRDIEGKRRARKTVTSYNRNGEAETLPDLIVARRRHACGSFITEKGDYVRFILNINKH